MSLYILLFHMRRDFEATPEVKNGIYQDMVEWEEDLQRHGKSVSTMPLYPDAEVINLSSKADKLKRAQALS